MARTTKSDLLGFLDSFNSELNQKILLIAVGGTAMTLLGIKASTKDIDFNIPSKEEYEEFVRVKNKIKPGVKIDCWSSNMIFTEILPENYVKLATDYPSNFDKISIKILNPIDIICSKISRSSDADMEDISDCIKNFPITKKEIIKRAQKYSRSGSDTVFNQNLEHISQNLF